MATYADGLVAYYPCGSRYDLWDLFDATYNGPVDAPGQGPIDSAWEFTNNTDVVSFVDTIPNTTGVYTISLWFSRLAGGFRNAVAMSSNESPIRIGAGGSDIGIRVGGVFYGTGFNPSGLVGSTDWSHITAVSDGTGAVEFFLNGGSIGTATAPSPLVGPFTEIGNINIGGSRAFAQFLSEIAFWDRQLTGVEVAALYEANKNKQDLRRLLEPQFALPSNKRTAEWVDMSNNALLYHLNDVGTANKAYDDSGNGFSGTGSNVTNISTTIKLHSGSLTPSGTVFTSASYYNGTNAYVDTNETPGNIGIDGNNSRSIVFWASSSAWVADKVLFTMGLNSSGQDFSLVTKGSNQISLNTWVDDAYWTIPTSTLGWNHYGLTYDSSSYAAKFYYNGAYVDTWYFGSPRNTTNSNDIRIGGPNYQWGYFTGGIQEFAIFSGSVLSDSEVLSIYNYQQNIWAPLSGSAALQSVFASVVHDGPPTINLDSLFGSIVHDGPSTANVEGLFGSVVHSSPVFNVSNITGTVSLTSSFDASGQGLLTGSTAYQWSWSSVPSGSSMANAILPLPDSGSTYPVSGNVGLWHFDSESSSSIPLPPTSSIGLVDSYGDGWHGNNYINLSINGVPTLINITLPAGYGPLWFDYPVSAGDSISITYTAGSYPGECSYILNDGAGGAGVDFFTSNSPPATPYSYTANSITTYVTPDSSGQGNNATPDGATFVSSSYVGSHCYEFDGVDDWIDLGIVPSDIGINGGNSRTIAFWASSSNWVDDTIFFSMGTNSNYEDFTLLKRAPSSLYLNTWNDDLLVSADNTPGWHHYFVIYDSSDGNVSLYQDNLFLGFEPVALNTSDANQILIGKGTGGYWVPNGVPYEGKIDEFAIWDRALSACERSTIYNFLQTGSVEAASGSSPNLLEQFSFVPDVTGSYVINLEMVDHTNCTSLTGSVTASIAAAGPPDCAGVPGGSAYVNSCGWCVGGTTGRHATYGQAICPDGSTICSSSSGGVPTGSCPGPIISGSGDELLVTSKYGLQYSKKASEQRLRRVEQIPFALSSKSFLSIRKKSDDEF